MAIVKFLNHLPTEFASNHVLLSGNESEEFSGQEYIYVQKDNADIVIFEIRYEYHCSPFKDAYLKDDLLVIGLHDYFYLFDISRNDILLKIKLNSYFGHLYYNDNHFYIVSATALYCVDKSGKIIWINNNLGIDGVVIHSFTTDKISGSGEWDPPEGWIDFILDKKSGRVISL